MRATGWRVPFIWAVGMVLSVFVAGVSPAQEASPVTGAGQAKGSPVVVLAAASTADALGEIARQFTQVTGTDIQISPGPSNGLAAQITQGAPADLFISANEKWAQAVADQGFTSKSVVLLTNDLVLIVPVAGATPVTAPADLLGSAVEHVALAGENVPAGTYGQQALAALKLYDPLLASGRIVRGQDVRVTLSYVERGEAQAGVVYRTDALASTKVKVVSVFDPATFAAIRIPWVLLKEGDKNPAAVKFYEYVQGPEATAIWEKHGFKVLAAPAATQKAAGS